MNQDTEDLEFEPAPPDKLYAHNRRQLSAMLDGELSPDQARFMLRRLQHDGGLGACWERWQVCGDVMRGQGHALLPADFSRRVAVAITAPDVGAVTGAKAGHAGGRRPRLLRWGGGALAASMALVALFMARQLPDTQLPAAAIGGTTVASASSAPAGARDSGDALATAAAAQAPVDAANGSTPGAIVAEGSGIALAAATGVVVAELPRRASERRSRGQSQRAARRVAAAAAPQPVMIAAAATATPAVADPALPPVREALPLFADVPDARTFGAPADAAFGVQTIAPTRPWPRAVLPGRSAGSQPFSARYGLPVAPTDPAFAPFHPRLADPDLARHGIEPGANAE